MERSAGKPCSGTRQATKE